MKRSDQLLITIFAQAQKDIEHFYLQAIRENNKAKAQYYAKQAQELVKKLQKDYSDRSLTAGAEEYLRGFQEVEKLKRGKQPLNATRDSDKILVHIGPIHQEAVMSLLNTSNRAVYATLDGVKKDIVYGVALFNQQGKALEIQHSIQTRLGAGLITGKSLHYQKSELVSFFQDRGLKLKDRSGRRRNPETYAEMLIRTERARAYNTGMLHRAIELGATKFQIDEKANCCSICAQHNGKIVDISKGKYELPPYHPSCGGTIHPIRAEDWRDTKIPNDQIGNHLLFDLLEVEKKYSGKESPIGSVNEAVLRNYSGQGYTWLNHNLRYEKPLNEEEEFKKKTLDKLFKHLSRPYDTVYRGVNIDIESYIDIIKTGTYSDKAFMSSSSDIKTADHFMNGNGKAILFEIKNAKGIPLKEYSSNPLEDEVLLPRNITYKVKEIKDTGKHLHIIME